jgi:hypothetical protein
MGTRFQECAVTGSGGVIGPDRTYSPLIEEIMKAGISVCQCPTNNVPGFIRLSFLTVEGGRRFLNMVARYEPKAGSLYKRLMGHPSPSDPATEKGIWQYGIELVNLNFSEKKVGEDGTITAEEHYGRPRIVFFFVMAFPEQDYPTVLKRMQRYNERRERKWQEEV